MAPKVTEIRDGFTNNKLLKQIEIPKSISFIDSNSFSGNDKLTSIKIPITFKMSEPNFGLNSAQWNIVVWISLGTTIIGGSYEVPGVQTILASDFNEDKIKEFIVANLLIDPPLNLTKLNIILKNLVVNNTKGKINLSFSINRYYDDNLVEQTDILGPVDLTLVGFKSEIDINYIAIILIAILSISVISLIAVSFGIYRVATNNEDKKSE